MTNTKVNHWKQNYNEYLRSPQWGKLRKQVKDISCNRCIIYPWRSVENIHHMHYKKVRGVYEGNNYVFTAGYDKPLFDLVPLSREGHKLVHSDFFWKKHRKITNYILRTLFILNILIGSVCRIGHFVLWVLGLTPKRKKKKAISLIPVTKEYKIIKKIR